MQIAKTPPDLCAAIRTVHALLEAETARMRRQLSAEIDPIHRDFLVAIDPDGTRQTELAVRTRRSKQAVNKLLNTLLDRKLLTVAVDPKDRRASLVRRTESADRRLYTNATAEERARAIIADSVDAATAARLARDLERLAGKITKRLEQRLAKVKVGSHSKQPLSSLFPFLNGEPLYQTGATSRKRRRA